MNDKLVEISEGLAREYGIEEHEGWIGPFSTRQVEGAIENGAKVVKIRSEKGDTHPVGSTGKVLGSISNGAMLAYWVEWDAHPKHAIFIVGFKLGRSIVQ
jgi:hypothetical protein